MRHIKISIFIVVLNESFLIIDIKFYCVFVQIEKKLLFIIKEAVLMLKRCLDCVANQKRKKKKIS